MVLTAGAFNKRIEIQQQTSERDEYGQLADTWTTVRRCWANIKYQKGRELATAAGFIGKVQCQITVRWSPFVFQKSHRVVFTDRAQIVHTFEIEAVINTDQSNKSVALLCYELDGDA